MVEFFKKHAGKAKGERLMKFLRNALGCSPTSGDELLGRLKASSLIVLGVALGNLIVYDGAGVGRLSGGRDTWKPVRSIGEWKAYALP